jgi:hypothetical protein
MLLPRQRKKRSFLAKKRVQQHPRKKHLERTPARRPPWPDEASTGQLLRDLAEVTAPHRGFFLGIARDASSLALW